MNVLIVEDEPAALRRMSKLLAEVDPTIMIAGTADTISDAVRWIEANPEPDLAFFDVQLADGESFEIFKHTEVRFPVIFTTAYDEHAIRAFRVNALDYLLKPVKKEELEAAVAKARKGGVVRDMAKASPEPAGGEPSPTPIKRFLIRYGDHYKVIEPKDIAYIHSLDKNTFIRTREGRDLPLDESLDRLEKQLDTEKFFRLNRQLIIHFESIKEMLAYSKSRVKVILAPPFSEDAVVSSERSAEFKRWLAGH
ncbi:MAG: response regulator transcription factor [Flavobacteriales bacterium]|nr:response regulator transcription factor [Flavobacteriales bacterium]